MQLINNKYILYTYIYLPNQFNFFNNSKNALQVLSQPLSFRIVESELLNTIELIVIRSYVHMTTNNKWEMQLHVGISQHISTPLFIQVGIRIIRAVQMWPDSKIRTEIES